MDIKSLIRGEIGEDELLNYYNACIIYEKLPASVRGFVFSYDGLYFIILGKYLCPKKMKHTLIHELAHIELNHLCQANKDLLEFYVDGYEDEANEYVQSIEKEMNERCDL